MTVTGIDQFDLTAELPDGLDVREVLRAYDLGFRGHSLVGFLLRNATHDKAAHLTALRQAHWYLGREIQHRQKEA